MTDSVSIPVSESVPDPVTVPVTDSAPDPTPVPDQVADGSAPVAPPRKPKPTVADQAAVQAVLERLFALYPQMFGARFLPLKLGVYQELLALHPDDFKKDDLKLALGQHARSTRYLEAVSSSQKRYDLLGQPVEDLAPEHVHHAIWEVYRRRQARSRENLGPRLLERIVAAIEASGLQVADYVERVRIQDVSATAALNDALALLAERAAKREALLRAYDASGRSPAEFAQMYGIELANIEQALARRNAEGLRTEAQPDPLPEPLPEPLPVPQPGPQPGL